MALERKRNSFSIKILVTFIAIVVIAVTSILVYASFAKVNENFLGSGTSTDMWYYETTIDGCEYILSVAPPGAKYPLMSLTHKGNCPNSFHKK
jgi:hypothetical protein